MEAVEFTYPGAEMPALTGVSFQLRPGESLALVGENGSGKTTLIKLLAGLYQPTAGSIRLDGIPLVCRTTGLPPCAPRQRVRVAFGEPDLCEVNVPCRYAGKPGAG